MTIFEAFSQSVRKQPKKKALLFFQNDQLQSWTYGELLEKVETLSGHFRRIGLTKGDRLAMITANSPQGVLVDLAAARSGLIMVPIHTTLSGSQMREVIGRARAKALVLGQLGAIESYFSLTPFLPALRESILELVQKDLPGIRHIILLNPPSGERNSSPLVHYLPDLLEDVAEGRGVQPLVPEAKRRGLDGTLRPGAPEKVLDTDVSTLMYTSGTTGEMKGVVITHHNIVSNAMASIDFSGAHRSDTHLAILPFSHAFERTCGLFMHLFIGATVASGRGPNFLLQDLQKVRPTLFAAVPRVLERICMTLQGNINKRSRVLGKMFALALKSKERSLQSKLADLLFFQNIRAHFGGNLKRIVCGGGFLDPQIARNFFSMGIPIIEGYGLTEASPVISINPWRHPKIGSVGKPLANLKVRIGPDNEILVRGPSVMKGYENNAAETRKVLTRDGWLHTGDTGSLDEEGYLYIKGRLKEMFVTTNGKNIYPSAVEKEILKCIRVRQVATHGDKRPHIVALVVPQRGETLKYAKIHNIAKSCWDNWAEFCRHPEAIQLFRNEINLANRSLAHHEQVKQFSILSEEFTEQNGLLTPTLKLRRKNIAKKYGDIIEAMYKNTRV